MNDAITTAQENLATVIDDAGALVFADDLPTVIGEPAQLVLLMQNLIGNAIKYRSKDSPKIHIEGMRGSKEWIFSVRDNGIGIEPEYHDLVFGLFKRLHNRTTPGAGMGLGIAKRIVELHGGRIWVDSALGHGSTFYFTIPTHRNHV
jgi:chemotaxis family two-component system sensor kinase Cph1